MDKKVKRELCESCGSHIPAYNTVYLTSEEKLTLVNRIWGRVFILDKNFLYLFSLAFFIFILLAIF